MNLDWHNVLGATASIILLLLAIPYARSIVKGSTRPSPISFFGWGALTVIAAAAQFSKGVDWSLAVPALSAAGSFFIAFFSLRLGRVSWTRTDGVSVILGVLALILWALTREPLTAIVLTILADIAVTMPTIVKTWASPTSEPLHLWITYTLVTAAAVVATTHLTIYNLLYPLYTVFGSLIITFLAARHRSR